MNPNLVYPTRFKTQVPGFRIEASLQMNVYRLVFWPYMNMYSLTFVYQAFVVTSFTNKAYKCLQSCFLAFLHDCLTIVYLCSLIHYWHDKD